MKQNTDVYDALPAEAFIPRSPRTSLKQKKLMRRLGREQQRGREDPQSWRSRYERHLASPEWQRFRERIMRQRWVMCERCGVSGTIKKLDVHHLSYARLGREEDEDVKLLCRDCHNLMHPRMAAREAKRKASQKN